MSVGGSGWQRVLRFFRADPASDVDAELRFHFEQKIADFVAQGMAPDAARARAAAEFGDPNAVRSDLVAIDSRIAHKRARAEWWESIAQDFWFALRYFARAPLVTATIVVLLAVAIGTNSIAFAFIDWATMQPPPAVKAGSRAVRIRGTVVVEGRLSDRWMDYREFAEYRSHSDVFEQVIGSVTQRMPIKTSGFDRDITEETQFVTNGFFALLGVTPELGSVLPADNDDTPLSAPSAVVSYWYWRNILLSSPDAIGKTITVGPIVATIVGVAPPGFNGSGTPSGRPRTLVFLPYSTLPSEMPERTAIFGRDRTDLEIVARLRKGVSMKSADALVKVIGARQGTEDAKRKYLQASDVVPLRANNGNVNPRKGEAQLLAMFGLVSFLILAIICSTVTALIVGRAVGRQREIGVRLSLGASRWRVVRQLLTESTMLAFAGGGLGLVLLSWLLKLSAQWAPLVPLAVGPLTVALTAALAIGTSVLIGLSPALHATRQSVFDALKQSGGITTWHTLAQRQLIVAQIALSQPLLVALGVLLVNALGTPRSSVDSELAKRVVAIEVMIPAQTTREPDRMRVIGTTARLADQLRAVPGVERTAYGDMGETRGTYQVAEASRTSAPMSDVRFAAMTRAVGPGYFDLLNIHVTSGRDFDQSDVKDAPHAIIIGSDLAEKLWGNANPIGRKLVNECKCEGGISTVVGVIDAKQAGASLVDGRMTVFSAFTQYSAAGYSALWVRAAKNPAPMLGLLRERIKQDSPAADIPNIQTLAEEDARHRQGSTRAASFASVAGVLALLLAALGLYAVVSFMVGQRSREIGVRIALGASSRQVVGQFFASGVKLALIGSAIGLPASAYAVSSATFGMFTRNDNVWLVSAEIAAVVTLVAMVATWIPARRAALVDPMTALRTE